MTKAALPTLMMLFLAFSGCFQADPPDLGADSGEGGGLPVAPLPPGCNPNVTGKAHTSGGAEAAWTDPQTVGCVAYTFFGTFEPTIGVHPVSGAVFVFPAQLGGPIAEVRIGRSTDEGASWTPLQIGVAGQSTHPYTVDPFMWLDPATGRIFADDLLTAHCASFSYSDDQGETWTNSVSGCTQADHVNIFGGPPVLSAPIGYPNVVYRCGINTVAVIYASFSSTCQKSLDGGRTWLQTGTPAFVTDPTARGTQGVMGWCDGALGGGAVGPDGTVYVAKGLCGTPMLAISGDEGLTWERVTVSDLGMMVAFCNNWDHEAGVGVDPEGNVYYAWVDNQRIPRLAVSRDGGRTFGEAFDIGPPGLTQAFQPQIAVGGVGRVAVAYVGSLNAPEGPFPAEPETSPETCETVVGFADEPAYADTTWNGYVMTVTDALAADPVFVSTTVNDPADPIARGKCLGIACPGQGDFIDVQIGHDGTPWAAFVDNCQGECVTNPQVSGNSDEAIAGRVWGVDLRGPSG